MPYRVLSSSADALGVVELSGIVELSDVEAALRALVESATWIPGGDTLWDARAVTGVRHHAEVVDPVAALTAAAAFADTAFTQEGGRAAIVTRDIVVAALTRLMAEEGPEAGHSVRTFGVIEGALAFLGHLALPERMELVMASLGRDGAHGADTWS